jgi:uncharacterized protein
MRERIFDDLKNAMKNQNKDLLAVIRMVKGAISLEEINKKRELNDDEIIDVISKQIKTRKESIIEFEKGNRNDLVEKTKSEIEILKKYMPEQLSEETIKNEIEKAFEEIKPTGMSDMGKIMGKVTPIFRGKTDMSSVSKIIKDKLSNI